VREEVERTDVGELIISVSIATVLFLLLSHSLTFHLTEPLMNDSSLMINSRIVITRDALDSISDDGKISIVATGSSMTFKALDGKCVGDQLGDEVAVYNIALPNSMPWNDMIHIPRLIESHPDIVLIEIGPNILDNISLGQLEYSEHRYKIDSSQQDSSDIGEWLELIDPRLQDSIALNNYERAIFRQEYAPAAIEEHLSRLLFDETNARDEWTYGWTPEPDGPDWMDYLQLPVFPPDRHGFDGMSVEEREEYNVTTMMKTGSNYRPAHHSSQAHAALDYEISTLLKNDIHVIIVGLPHHPTALTYVEEGRWDGFNETMSKYSQWPGVTVFDQSWESGWEDEHFFDRNHLDDEGRAEFCARLAPVLELILED